MEKPVLFIDYQTLSTVNLGAFNGAQQLMPLLAERYAIWTILRQRHGDIELQKISDDIDRNVSGHLFLDAVSDKDKNKLLNKFNREVTLHFRAKIAGFVDCSAENILTLQDTIPSYWFEPNQSIETPQEIKHRLYTWWGMGSKFLC